MAKIVAAFATSHTPGLGGWIEEEEEPKRKKVFAGLAELRRRVEAAKPDVIIGIAADHMLTAPPYNMPDFAVGVAEEHIGPAPGYETWLRIPQYKLKGNRPLACALVDRGAELGVNFFAHEKVDFDDNFTIPLKYLTPNWDVPFVPVLVNCFMHPRPQPRRAYQVGQIIKHVITQMYPGNERVALMATGGMSHEPGGPRNFDVDEEFDRWFLGHLTRGDHEKLLAECTIERMDKAGNGGTTELLAWIMVMAATEGAVDLVTYQATHVWRAGTGIVWWPAIAPPAKLEKRQLEGVIA